MLHSSMFDCVVVTVIVSDFVSSSILLTVYLILGRMVGVEMCQLIVVAVVATVSVVVVVQN